MNTKKIVKVDAIHIEAGIKKYEGVVDLHLHNIIQAAGLNYTPYTFKDGRILLVLPNELAAFLYKDEETVFETLSLGRWCATN